MKISKIILFIVSFILSFLFFTKGVFALENPNYKFLKGGYPVFSDYPYDISYSSGDGKSVTLTGSLYPRYHPSIITYMPHTIDKKIDDNSQLFGFSAWNGYIFVEAKKLREGHNFIFSAEKEAKCIDYETCEYLSNIFGKKLLFMDIECPKEGDCFINIGVGFPVKYSQNHDNEYKKGRTIDLSLFNKIAEYPIKRDGKDFMLYAEVTIQSGGTYEEGYNSLVSVELNMETEQGSGIMRKINEPFQVVGTFPESLGSTLLFDDYIQMNFLDHTKVFPFSKEIIEKDLEKIIYSVGDKRGYDYYRAMNLNLFDYIITNLGFKDKGDGFGPGTYRDDIKKIPQVNWDDVKKGKSDFEFQNCEGLDILCHIKNGVGYIGYLFGKIFSSIFSPIFSFLSWVKDGITNFFSGLLDKILGFFGLSLDFIKSIVTGISDFTKNAFENIKNFSISKNNSFDITFSCDNLGNFRYSSDVKTMPTIFQIIFDLFKNFAQVLSLAFPIIPDNGQSICTYGGMKTILYRNENTIFDYFLVLFSSFGTFLFLLKFAKND